MSDFFSRTGMGHEKNYHSYVPQDAVLRNIGLGSYSRNTLDKFGMERRNGQLVLNVDVAEYFGGSVPKTILLADSSPYWIWEFNRVNGSYEQIYNSSIFVTPSGNSAGSLSEYQTEFDKLQKGFTNGWTDNKKYIMNYTWSKICNSRDGCISFEANYSFLGTSNKSTINLFFQEGKGGAKSSRKIAQNGAPIIVDVLKDPVGYEWSYGGTKNEGTPGTKVPVSEGGTDNPHNNIAAPLSIAYDEATNTFEAGTFQVMAQLDEDLDGVPQRDVPRDSNLIQNSEYISGSLRIKPNFAQATVMSSHNGNPHLFGPTQMGCGTNVKQKITLVNRTSRNFKKNELVLASRIGGVWVPMGFGIPETVPKKFGIEWSQIQKYITNAKSFFCDSSANQMTDTDYIEQFRVKFYSSLASSSTISSVNDKTKLQIINLNKLTQSSVEYQDGVLVVNGDVNGGASAAKYRNMIPSTGYLQAFDSDQIKTNLGGNNTAGTFMNRTNINRSDLKPDEYGQFNALDFPFNWGMFFSDGYGSAGVTSLRNYTGTTTASGQQIYTGGGFSLIDNNTPYLVSGGNLYNFPAQMALNSSGNQSIFLNQFWPGVNGNVIDNTKNYFKNPIKGGFLNRANGQPLYGLSPVNGKSVQFYPLQMELALADLVIPDAAVQNGGTAITRDNGGWGKLKNQILGGYGPWGLAGEANNGENKFLGKLWSRSGRNPESFVDNRHSATFRSRIGVSDKLAPNSIAKIPETSVPVGGPNIIPMFNYNGKERSNVVGIVAAKATIDMSNGGLLSLQTISNYGIVNYAYDTVAGQSWATAIIGNIMAAVQNLSGQSRNVSMKQWGSQDDDKPSAFGTTALWCKVYDHCPSVVYDGRYFAPLQFNPNDSSVDITIPSGYKNNQSYLPLGVGNIVPSGYKIIGQTNSVRRGMLLSAGGFGYIKRFVGADPTSYEIKESGTGFAVGNIIQFGGETPAEFKVTAVNPTNSGIVAIQMNTDERGQQVFGDLDIHSFESGPMIGSPVKGESDTVGTQSYIILKRGKIYEKVVTDPEPQNYGGATLLSYPSNGGEGVDKGLVEIVQSIKQFSLNKNSTGKYDIFFFFTNDILHTLLTFNSLTISQSDYSPVNYVKLEISAT